MILRKDLNWTIKNRPGSHSAGMLVMSSDCLQRLRLRFHDIARCNGSHATWLPETGFLVTDDIAEPTRSFPYEDWLDQAFKEIDQKAPSSGLIAR